MSLVRTRAALPLLLSLLGPVACDSTTEGSGELVDFHLSLVPVLPPSHEEIFDQVVLLDVVTQDSSGNTIDRMSISAPERYTQESVTGLTALAADTVIALEGYDAEGELVVWGRTAALTVEAREELKLTVFASGPGEFSVFEELETPTWGAAVVSDGQGRFHVLGGLTGDLQDSGVSGLIWSLDLLPPASDLAPVERGSLPNTWETWADDKYGISARAHLTATLLSAGDHADLGKILVAGGWADWEDDGALTAQAFLYDPASGDPELSGDMVPELLDDMVQARAGHQAFLLPSGHVVLIGGYAHFDTHTECARSIEVYDPSARTFTKADWGSDKRCALDGAGAIIADDQVLYCGGVYWEGFSYGAYDECLIVDSSGAVSDEDAEDVPDLPVPLLFPAMAALEGGRALISGGVELEDLASSGEEITAGNRAWIYDPASTSWSETSQPMNVRRAGHMAVALDDGRVLVAGGAVTMVGAGEYINQTNLCAEIYDPDEGSWTPLTVCNEDSEVGSLPQAIFRPSYATDPIYGTLLVGGLTEDDRQFSPTVSMFMPGPGAASE